MIYNILGDIHFRNNWKDLINDDYINIFVGDYFSPYKGDSNDDECFNVGKRNFLDIIKYKKEHPETVLLVGNHDEDHWHIRERYSRHDFMHCDEISELFESNKELFQTAYSINNEVLVTHAGVSMIWYMNYKYGRMMQYPVDLSDDNESKTIDEAADKVNAEISNEWNPRYFKDDRTVYLWKNNIYWFVDGKFQVFYESSDDIADFINKLWKSGNYRAFNFRANASPNDGYGEDVHHGPMWIRPAQLQEANIFKYTNRAQVVGHTQYKKPIAYVNNMARIFEQLPLISNEEDKIIFCDCLGYSASSILYDTDTKIFTINK